MISMDVWRLKAKDKHITDWLQGKADLEIHENIWKPINQRWKPTIDSTHKVVTLNSTKNKVVHYKDQKAVLVLLLIKYKLRK